VSWQVCTRRSSSRFQFETVGHQLDGHSVTFDLCAGVDRISRGSISNYDILRLRSQPAGHLLRRRDEGPKHHSVQYHGTNPVHPIARLNGQIGNPLVIAIELQEGALEPLFTRA